MSTPVPDTVEPDRLLHEPGRHAVCIALCLSGGESSFPKLRKDSGLSDGNLHRHLAALAAAGVVEITNNGALGRASRTAIRFTGEGVERLARHAGSLERAAAVFRGPREAASARGDGLANHLL